MALGGREVNEAVGAEPLLRISGPHDHLALEDDDEGVLVDLVVGEALPLGEAEQDDAVGIVVGTQDARRTRLDRLAVQFPDLHVAQSIILRAIRCTGLRCARLGVMELAGDVARTASRPRFVLLDVNGTLTDLAPIGRPWDRPELGERALDGAVQSAMVDALLERGGRPFADHVRAALGRLVADAGLDPGGIEAAMQAAAALPARPGAAEALAILGEAGVGAVALTNSGADAGAATLRGCGLAPYVERVLGVDAVETFKPHPRVYAYALGELGAAPGEVTLIATHPWDLAGAAHAAVGTAWVTHGARGWPEVFPAPDIRGDTLPEVARKLVG